MTTTHDPAGSTQPSGPHPGAWPHQGPSAEELRLRAGELTATLTTREGGGILVPEDPRCPVIFTDPGPSCETAYELGIHNGDGPGFDGTTHVGSGKVPVPHQGLVIDAVSLPLAGVAAAGENVLAATDASLGHVEPQYPGLPRQLGPILAVVAVLLAASIVEWLIGTVQWLRVVGGDTTTASGIALGVVVMFGVLSWVCSGSLSHRRPGILREHGGKLFAAGATLMTLFAAGMAYAFSGGVDAPTIGGISGGSTAGIPTSADGTDIEWMKWAIYLLVTLLFVWAVIMCHLWHSTSEDRRRVAAHVPVRLAAERASIADPVALLRLRAALLRTVCDSWSEGVARAKTILKAFDAGVRATLPPALHSGWDHTSVSEPTFNEPDWLHRLRGRAEELEDRAQQLEGARSAAQLISPPSTGRG